MKGLIRFDDSCKLGLKHFLLAQASYNLPVNGIQIIKDVLALDFDSGFEVVCFCNNFKLRFSDSSASCA